MVVVLNMEKLSVTALQWHGKKLWNYQSSESPCV